MSTPKKKRKAKISLDTYSPGYFKDTSDGAGSSRSDEDYTDGDDDYNPVAAKKTPASTKKSSGKKKPASKVSDKKQAKPSSGSKSTSKVRKINFKGLPKLSSDVNVILKKVAELQQKEKKRYADKPRKSLQDLSIEHVKKEVDSMDAEKVRVQLEELVFHTVNSILSDQGFSYSVPSRNSNNQLYVPELDRIVLKDKVAERVFASVKNARKTAITTRIIQLIYELCLKRIHVTKRDLFYTDVKLFVKQAESDDVLDDVACMIGSTRSSLNVVASEKGIVVGRLSFRDDGDLIDCTRMGVGGKAIPPYIDRVTEIEGDAKFVLLVEKDAAFMRLAEDRFYNQYPCIIITAKGQPDVATRLFLKKVKTTLKIPVLGLVDSDPYGLKILSVYMSGSKNMSYDSASLTTPDIHWLGVRPSDLDKYNIPEQCRLDMTEHDIKTGKELLEEDFIKKNPIWYQELQLMVKLKKKAEIQALSNFGFQYLTQVYLPLKLQEGDWV